MKPPVQHNIPPRKTREPKKKKKTSTKDLEAKLVILITLIVILAVVSVALFIRKKDSSGPAELTVITKDAPEATIHPSTPTEDSPAPSQSEPSMPSPSEQTLEDILQIPPIESEEDLPKEIPLNDENKVVRNARLFFIVVNDEGYITLKSSLRSIYYETLPLAATIRALLAGLTAEEINKGLLTLIPEGSKLLSAKIENDTAFLDFNEAFRFNTLGVEGYAAQLQQVVFTATEFTNIKSVQFLLEGKQDDYLGAEGFYIGKPISRSSFR